MNQWDRARCHERDSCFHLTVETLANSGNKPARLSAIAKQNPTVAIFRYRGVKFEGAELRSNG